MRDILIVITIVLLSLCPMALGLMLWLTAEVSYRWLAISLFIMTAILLTMCIIIIIITIKEHKNNGR